MVAVPIKEVVGRLCFNSRGQETVEVDVKAGDCLGRAMAPAGASVGRFEAQNFPEGGVREALRLLKEYSTKLVGLDASDPKALTSVLRGIDGTPNYSRIGGATAYAVSMAAAEAAALHLKKPLYSIISPTVKPRLPFPLGNFIGGGKHAGPGAPDIQELLACPLGAKRIEDALRANITVHSEARKLIERKQPLFAGGKGDEGAWAANLSNEDALTVAAEAVATASDKLGFRIRLGVDFAASTLWSEKDGVYVYARSGKKLTPEEQINFVAELKDRFDLFYLEDPLHEDAFEEFCELSRSVKGTLVVGDDLLVTNPGRLKTALSKRSCNGAILKVNQAGSLGDALEFAQLATANNIVLTTSHRSGDTVDSHISHVAIATGSKMIKTGIVGGERIAKLNELLRVNERIFLESGSEASLTYLSLGA
jgi:enolase